MQCKVAICDLSRSVRDALFPPLPLYSGGEGRGEGVLLPCVASQLRSRASWSAKPQAAPLTLTLSPGVPGERGPEIDECITPAFSNSSRRHARSQPQRL